MFVSVVHYILPVMRQIHRARGGPPHSPGVIVVIGYQLISRCKVLPHTDASFWTVFEITGSVSHRVHVVFHGNAEVGGGR